MFFLSKRYGVFYLHKEDEYMQSKEIQSWQEQSALTRYGLIAPLLEAELDPVAKTKLREEISERTGISTRTIYGVAASRFFNL